MKYRVYIYLSYTHCEDAALISAAYNICAKTPASAAEMARELMMDHFGLEEDDRKYLCISEMLEGHPQVVSVTKYKAWPSL